MGEHFKNASWSGAVTGFRALSGLANALLAVRLVGVDGYGHLAALLSVFVLYLSLNTSLYTVLVTKLMSPAGAEDPRGRSETLAATALVTACAIALLLLTTGITFWVAPSFLGLGHPGMGLAFLMMGALVAVQILAALQAAIIEAPRGKIVYVVDASNKASVRPVEVTYPFGEEAVVTGLRSGERIVVDGRQNLRPGATVVERAATESSRPRRGASGASAAASGGASVPRAVGAASGAASAVAQLALSSGATP